MARHPALYQINTRVWLRELDSLGERPATLADIPDRALDHIASLGFDYIWFLGLWQTGPAGRLVSLSRADRLQEFRAALPDFTEADVTGSPFAVAGYTLHRDFGDWTAIVHLRERLQARGLGLIVDFVPNHTALDHPWVREHPEFYIHGSEIELEREPANYRKAETCCGPAVLAHGRDPNFPGWQDTFQLNYRHPGLREAMAGELVKLSGSADGVRCDMAMLLLPEVILRTWGDRSLPADGAAPVDTSFWPEAIGRAKAQNPHFVLIAEAYWGLEPELLRQGFDYAYDKQLYDHLAAQDPEQVLRHLEAYTDYQEKMVRFLENHDEPRAAHRFPLAVHQAAATTAYFLPGLRFFQEGQLEGRRAPFSMHLGRRPPEPVDPVLQNFYRDLLNCLKRPEVRDGCWHLLEVRPAREDNPTWRRFLAFIWEGPEARRLLVTVNYGPTPGQAYVDLSGAIIGRGQIRLESLMGEAVHRREVYGRHTPGLYLDLPAWGFQIFVVSAF